MNLYYVKTALYVYPVIEAVIGQIDDLVERKAMTSMYDFSPCELQCEKILSYTEQKIVLTELKEFTDKILFKLTDYELDCLDYKYFKIQPKEYFNEIGFDVESRRYFRKQQSLVGKVAKLFDRVGVSDEWFEKKCLNIEFFSDLLKIVKLREVSRSKKKKSNAENAALEKSA